jgi:hypothetical protein
MAAAGKSLRHVARAMATMWGGQVAKRPKVDPAQLQPLIYPYSWTAKVIQFDWLYMYKNAWFPRYWLYATIVCYPLWVWIHFKGM